jgi:glycosyltransferase involved in cell wall biosynthesis
MGSVMAYLASLRMDPSGRFRLLRLESRGGRRIYSPFLLVVAMCRIVAEAAMGRLAVVHLNLAEPGSVYRKGALLLAAKLVGARALLHLHATQIVAEQQAMPPVRRFLLRLMFRSADRVVVGDDRWSHWVTNTLGVTPRAVTVLRNGLSDATISRVARRDNEPFRLMFLGTLLQREGIADLLHALAATPGPPVALTVSGGGPVETYRQVANSLGIGDRVHFTGWTPQAEARDLLAASDALVLPAYDEGPPLVVLEAMAIGVPVICTPVGTIPEIFEDRRTALFVLPGNRRALSAAIATLRDDPALQASLSSEGLALYERDFTMNAFATGISAIYAVLDRRRPFAKPFNIGCVMEAGHDR